MKTVSYEVQATSGKYGWRPWGMWHALRKARVDFRDSKKTHKGGDLKFRIVKVTTIRKEQIVK